MGVVQRYSKERMRPEYVAPELARRYRALAEPLRAYLLARPGVVGAWLCIEALADGKPGGEAAIRPLSVLMLIDSGHESSEAMSGNGVECTLLGVREDALREAIDRDHDITRLLGEGYRLCGGDDVIFELEALAREIMGRRQ